MAIVGSADIGIVGVPTIEFACKTGASLTDG
jgi:hypothetical protein